MLELLSQLKTLELREFDILVAVIQLALPDPPVSPFTSVAPLVFVIVSERREMCLELTLYGLSR